MKTILVVAAHPDDEVLGCGGTVARLARQGSEVYTLILGEGITSRDDTADITKKKAQVLDLQKKAELSNKALGVREVFFSQFDDNKFDTIALLEIVKTIEQIKSRLKPTAIFTHFENDLNIDHKITYHAVLTATRPVVGESVKEIYAFEVLSSTEWGWPLSFSPDTFFDISDTMDLKLNALKHYDCEMRDFPHPRSFEAVKLNSKTWGMKVGLEYAEAFKCVRTVK